MSASAATKRHKTITMGIPNWTSIQPGMEPIRGRDYSRLMWEAEMYVHYDVKYSSRASNFIKYVRKNFGDEIGQLMTLLPDSEFISIGKYTYAAMKGAGLDEMRIGAITRKVKALVEKATTIKEQQDAEKAAAEAKSSAPAISIKQRMRDQLEEIGGDLEVEIDKFMTGQLSPNDFAPYKMMAAYQPEIKPLHAKIIQEMYEPIFEEAKLVVAFKDDDIKEAYANTTAAFRKGYLQLIQKILDACDTISSTAKAKVARKPKARKAIDKAKQVAKVSFQTNEPSLGLSSINPVEIVGCQQLWVYNTKTRKLGVYIASSSAGSLSVKGTTIIGYDIATSQQKTIRKPDVDLKGIARLPKTRIKKFFDSVKTTETALRSRTSPHTVLVKAF